MAVTTFIKILKKFKVVAVIHDFAYKLRKKNTVGCKSYIETTTYTILVVIENQILQKGDITIDNNDENTTLVDVDIFAGDQIILRDSEIHENRDIADELCNEEKGTGTRHTEGGFHGTLLTSNVSSQVV
ncbi:ubiquitin carboxyl-terminal hydrolase 26-like protein [Trifolium pratense]|uniref:Ubiquitin carboxyl-terminal hydrolase 26-like protein n=1 Tax=Trifolium pratense TaxID=57577 RepID=A0A2K3PHA2_TRIPR|nr:ubiquitin carboxyl-terminal hydrolase 26-like protein [Trifolium pratense]